jgi:hypothetical protein
MVFVARAKPRARGSTPDEVVVTPGRAKRRASSRALTRNALRRRARCLLHGYSHEIPNLTCQQRRKDWPSV